MISDPTLSILVIFYNNRREAPNTLYSLSAKYQANVDENQYQVIVIDSGSSEPLDRSSVESYGPNFSYHAIDTKHPSPTESLRFGLNLVNTPYIGVIIDGAHILSPGIINYFFEIQSFKPNSFVYTTKYHLGNYHQNDSMILGYNQATEDVLIKSVNWKENGYLLYHICNFFNSPFNEFVVSLESNCFFILTERLRESKIFDKPYYSLGGGFINLDLFKHFIEDSQLDNYLILGEGTFHQFHGGASTNVERASHPIKAYREEYYNINKVPFLQPSYETFYFGTYNKTISEFQPRTKASHIKSFLDKDLGAQNPNALLTTIEYAIGKFPFNMALRLRLAEFYKNQGKFELAENTLLEARDLSRQTLQAPKALYQLYLDHGKFEQAKKYIDEAIDIKSTDPILYLLRAQLAKTTNDSIQLNADINEARKYLDKGIGENPIIHSNVVFYLMDLGKIGLAGKYLKQALPLFPDYTDLLSLAINILPRTNDKVLFRETAERITKVPINQRPEHLFKRLGFAYQYIGDYQQSVACYQQFIDTLGTEDLEAEAFTIYNHILSMALTDQSAQAKENLLRFKRLSFAKDFKNDINLVQAIFKLQENKIDETLTDVLDLMEPLFSKAVFRELVDRLLLQLNEKQTVVLLTAYLNHVSQLPRNISIPHQELLQRINNKNNRFKKVKDPTDISKIHGEIFDGFIFTHIQKTAGTSIRRYFAWASKLSNILISQTHIPGEFDLGDHTNTIQLNEAELNKLANNKVKIMLEHHSFHEVLPSYLSHLKNPFQYTILRNPLARFVSYYYFFYYGRDPIYHAHLNDLSPKLLEKFIRKCNNLQTAYIAGVDWHINTDQTIGPQQLEKAKENLVSKFHSFGIFESLDLSLELLRSAAPDWLVFPDIDLPVLNKTRHPDVIINDVVKSTFNKFNQYDNDLYYFAKEKFNQRYSEKVKT